MFRFATLVPIAAIAFGAGCDNRDDMLDLAQFEADNLEWRAARLERLRGPEGYLNLAGLFWLDEGTLRIGSATGNDIVFPAAAPPQVGELKVSSTGVTLQVSEGVTVFSNGQPVQTIFVADDTSEAPVTISHGAIAWTIIRRDDRFALRLRDFEHPAIAAFPPIEYFPINPDLRVRGKLRLFAEPKVLNVDTVIEGLGWNPESPGVVEFEIDGQSLQLEAYDSGDKLFFVFGDRTSGRETYPAGRFLYSDRPAEGDETILDFNRAYNPPCAFNDFATCPVASPQNRLSVRIEAGERFDPQVHATPDSIH
ncbi:MAG: DUF1684 domain-containing protein [Gammaproteobacteria bacterium]|nr:DUF1684 domain-containing protein [Gammaproteobacteria bacterium]MDH5302998.1 DUF1684 domain-containing protein [Gammaproteobacteria bacterium]MDH5321255.1 DUF1684 domain-containing protein [Gammaproteobacteria bacterium]